MNNKLKTFLTFLQLIAYEILTTAVSATATWVRCLFKVKTGEHRNNLFPTTIYRLSYPMIILGVILFITAYIFIWKKLTLPTLIKIKAENKYLLIIAGILSAAVLFGIFTLTVIELFFIFGFGDTENYNITIMVYEQPVFCILYPILRQLWLKTHQT